MRKLVIAAVAVAVLVIVAVVVLVNRPGGGADPVPPAVTDDTSPTATEDAGWTRAEIAQALFEGDAGTSESLAAVTGEIQDPHNPVPANVEVTSVIAGEASTVVRFTLRHLEQGEKTFSLSAFNSRTPLTRDIRDVALVVPDEDVRLQPFLGVPVDTEKDGSFCTCATAPVMVSGAGQLLSATFPALAAGTTTVSLEVPGFPLVEGLPVTRN